MEKKTLEELLILANQSLQDDMDLRIVLENPDGAYITLSLTDTPAKTVVIDYVDSSGKKWVDYKYWGGPDFGDLFRFVGLDCKSTDWFIGYMTFLQLDEIEDRIKKLRKNLSPYKED